MFRKVSAVFLCLVLCIVPFGLRANAITYPVYAVVSHNNGGPIYSQPGFIDSKGHDGRLDKTKPSTLLITLSKGEKIKVLGDSKDGDGDLWYQVCYGDNYANKGYIYSTRIKFVGNYTEDTEFEKWLTDQGFPESYKEALRDIHSIYPNWVFYADHIDLEWSDVVTAEITPDAYGEPPKVVHSSRDNSWKSMESGYYDWTSNTWNTYDNGNWVAASERVVAYYMDPRNFLDTTNIFMFFSQSFDSRYDNIETLQQFVKGTFMDAVLPDDTTKTYSQVIMEAAEYSKVSPYVIVSTICQEQGVDGTGGCISGTVEGYEGLYNFFNVGATGSYPVQRGLWWANGRGKGETTYGRPWTNRTASIKGGAEYYSAGYIAVGQNTFYYMNFNVYNTSHQYATNIEDTKAKTSFLASAYASLNDYALVFHIPVYKNMPDATTLPTSGTSNNRYLSALTVAGHEDELETFDRYKYSYELIVSNDTDSITINATPSDSNAAVTGTGKQTLQVGNNEFKITVTSTSGISAVYTITVFRESSGSSPETPDEPDTPVIPEPEITGSYTVGTYITGVQPETTVSSFITNLGVKNGSAKVFSSAGAEKTGGNVATGDRVQIFNNSSQIKMEYTVVIYGDANGDGKISSVDLLVCQLHILKKSSLSGAYLKAADVNKDSSVSSVDLLVCQRHILKFATITQ